MIDKLEPASLAEAAKQPTTSERGEGLAWIRYYYGSWRARIRVEESSVFICNPGNSRRDYGMHSRLWAWVWISRRPPALPDCGDASRSSAFTTEDMLDIDRPEAWTPKPNEVTQLTMPFRAEGWDTVPMSTTVGTRSCSERPS